MHPLLGTWPATQPCALTRDWTGDPLVCRLALSPLSHTRQSYVHYIFIRWCVSGHLGCFLNLPVVNNAGVNIGAQTAFQISIFVFFGWIPTYGIAGSYASCFFYFLRNIRTIFPSGCTSLHSHQQCMQAPFSPHPLQLLLFLVFLIITILIGVRWLSLLWVWFAFLWWLMMLIIFSCALLAICYISWF